MKGSMMLFLVFGLLLFGCPADSLVCNEPYIQVGTECCLDVNDNDICDSDEHLCEENGEDICIGDTRKYNAVCVDGEWMYQSETCDYGCEDGVCAPRPPCADCPATGQDCDGTKHAKCSDKVNGFVCNDGILQYDSVCFTGEGDCSDGTLNGYCSFLTSGYYCSADRLYEDEECLDACRDGTSKDYCSRANPGYACVDGKLELDEECPTVYQDCDDGTPDSRCSESSIGYWCDDGELLYSEYCFAEIGEDCHDGTELGDCSITHNGFSCDGGLLEYDSLCPSHGGDCVDGTMNGYCSFVNPGYYCFGDRLHDDAVCDSACRDGTAEGYCSRANPGYECEDGNLLHYWHCQTSFTSCDDGTPDTECSESSPGYWCDDGAFEYGAYCEERESDCYDGTPHNKCSSSYTGYGCWDGELYLYEECGAEIVDVCLDGTLDGYCSDYYEGYACIDGELVEHSDCEPKTVTCEAQAGKILCGFCSEDDTYSGNPYADKCIYCPQGTYCAGTDICGDVTCVSYGDDYTDGDGTAPTRYYASCSQCQGYYSTYSYSGYDYGVCNTYYQICVQAMCQKILDNCR